MLCVVLVKNCDFISILKSDETTSHHFWGEAYVVDDKRRTLLTLGRMVKDKCQVWHSVYKTRGHDTEYDFSHHIQTLHRSFG